MYLPETMLCATYLGPRTICVEQRPTPVPGPGEVLLKVMACGICGSDVHIFEGDQGSTVTVPPQIQGHEFSGVIACLPKGGSRWSLGQRVTVDPADHCNSCYYCLTGRMSHCKSMRAIGTNVDGGFAQYCLVPDHLVYPIADDISFEAAALTEPLACCLNGLDRAQIQAGDTVLIYGAGTIGLLMLQLARMSGADRVVVVEPVARKRELAMRLGACVALDPEAADLEVQVERAGGCHIRVVMETTGLSETAEQAVRLVDRAGRILLFGVPSPDGKMQLSTYDVYQKELTICGSFCSPYTFQRAVQLINAHRLDVSSMVAGTAPLDSLAKILNDPQKRSQGKWIILPQVPLKQAIF